MALTGKNTEQKIWNYLKAAGYTDHGVAGLMGNLYAESALRPNNLQNSYEKKLGYTDDSYTAAVDDGSYTGFIRDSAGYGLAQWTYWSRKENLLKFAQKAGKSIGDLEMQLAFLVEELKGYKGVHQTLKTATSVKEASDSVLVNFERPADQSDSAKARRAGYGQKYYDEYAGAAAQPSTPGSPLTEAQLRQKVVSIAQGWLGCNEADGSHKKIIDVYNGHKPLARGYAVKYTDAWCSTFASAVAIEAELTDIIPTECGCEKHINLFKELGSWQENDAYVPDPGDYVFYDWDDSGTGDNTGWADHVGIVEKTAGGIITVIEGNYSNSVKRRNISVNGKYIRGFGVPDYASKATTVAPEEEPSAPGKTVDELAKEVIDGKWGNGAERKQRLTAAGYDYSAIQARVNEILSGTSAEEYETYTVVRGDSLWAIAKKKLGNGNRYPEIVKLNGLTSTTIYAGQILKLPK